MSDIRYTIDSTSTRIRQTSANDQQGQNYNGQQYPEGDNDNNNYYPARARACAREELPPAEIMQRIAQAYRDNIGPMITRVAAGIIERALQGGMEPETVILAIEETGMAPRPSPYYMSAVLRHWAETGVVLSRSKGGADVSTTQARPWWR